MISWKRRSEGVFKRLRSLEGSMPSNSSLGLAALFSAFLACESSQAARGWEGAFGFTASRGILGAGYAWDRSFVGFGLSREFYAGSTGFFAGPAFTFEQRLWADGHTPFLSLTYAPIFSSQGFSWNGREWDEGLNPGLISTSLGYSVRYKRIAVPLEISVDTPIDDFTDKWRFQWGLGIAFHFGGGE